MTTENSDYPTLVTTVNLGALIRRRRREQGLRIDDAAGLMDVSVDLMSRLENGQGTVRLEKVLSVLDGLGLALTVLPKYHSVARAIAGAGSASVLLNADAN
jgi:transcriptional regulator with XRE-family HTH domain